MVNCICTCPKVLIDAFRLYEIAIDLAVAIQLVPPLPELRRRHAPVPLPLGLAIGPANYISYWLSLFGLLGTWRLFREPYSILVVTADAGGCT
jgi:hypothetical protein